MDKKTAEKIAKQAAVEAYKLTLAQLAPQERPAVPVTHEYNDGTHYDSSKNHGGEQLTFGPANRAAPSAPAGWNYGKPQAPAAKPAPVEQGATKVYPSNGDPLAGFDGEIDSFLSEDPNLRAIDKAKADDGVCAHCGAKKAASKSAASLLRVAASYQKALKK